MGGQLQVLEVSKHNNGKLGIYRQLKNHLICRPIHVIICSYFGFSLKHLQTWLVSIEIHIHEHTYNSVSYVSIMEQTYISLYSDYKS